MLAQHLSQAKNEAGEEVKASFSGMSLSSKRLRTGDGDGTKKKKKKKRLVAPVDPDKPGQYGEYILYTAT
jgi:methionine-rich copper-binding protein CopC